MSPKQRTRSQPTQRQSTLNECEKLAKNRNNYDQLQLSSKLGSRTEQRTMSLISKDKLRSNRLVMIAICFIIIFCLMIASHTANAFNLENRLPLTKFGAAGSYFGYSVAEHVEVDDEKFKWWVLMTWKRTRSKIFPMCCSWNFTLRNIQSRISFPTYRSNVYSTWSLLVLKVWNREICTLRCIFTLKRNDIMLLSQVYLHSDKKAPVDGNSLRPYRQGDGERHLRWERYLPVTFDFSPLL